MRDQQFYDGLQPQGDSGPMECDHCHELVDADACYQCPWCGETICDFDWKYHRSSHEE